MHLFAEHVDPETARKVATTFLSNNGAKTDQLTDLSKEAGFSNLYIFNGNPGFVVMAADDCVKPILGYSLTGKFVVEDMPENVIWWLKGYNDQLQDAIDNHARSTSETAKQWKDLTAESGNPTKAVTVVGPLITTNWDQWYPYNYYCPPCSVYSSNGGHTLTGCVATAMAQVIKYHNKPVHGIGSHSYTHGTFGQLTADFSSTYYDWTNMPTHINSSSSSTQIDAVATLIYHCGVAVDMDYGRTISGAYSTNIAPALKNYFNFSQSTAYHNRADYSNSDWVSLMRNELNNSRPIVYGGLDDETNPSSGHSFVCDGYDADTYSNLYFHFNWGWSGSYNGYFSIDDMTPGGNGAGGGTHNYSYLQDAVIGIQPSTNTAIPSNLTYSLTGPQDLTLSWTVANGTSSYNIYRNENLIGKSTETTYTETAPFGTNVYWVRSVDANDELSLSSNSVIVYVSYQTPVVDDLEATLSGNNASLTWTAPDWCYPETPSATLTYGDGIYLSSLGYNGSQTMYWGHRYLSSALASYAGMVIYKISFYASVAGTYQYLIYKGTNTYNDEVYPQSQIANGTITTLEIGWFDITLAENQLIDESQDLWVFMYDPEYKGYPASFCSFSDHTEGCYFASSNPLNTYLNTYQGVAWLINTCLTDGTYTYNLYDGPTKVNGAVPITGTTYSVNNLADGVHQFTVKTNYYGGESEASNMAGLTLGTPSPLETLKLGPSDAMVLTNGSTLSVTGTLENTNPANLVIEDGAQLIHPNSAVQATLNKTIQPYTEGVSDGWYTIASPVDHANTSLVTNGNYDLYSYDEKNMLWLNQKKPANNITGFDEGEGFLYANAAVQALRFAGNMKATDEQVTVPLSYQSSNENLKGFNLVGNPFTRNLNYGDITLGGAPLTIYYSVEDGTQLEAHNISTTPIKPGQGFMVQASAEGQNLVFNPSSSKEQAEANPGYISIEASDGIFTDRAFVQFDGGNILHKTSLSDNSTRLSVTRHHADFAAIIADASENELTLSFKAVHDGPYTLNVSITNLDLEYLHLVDHLTGADIDLLQNPSYTFEAKTNDYAARFKLVFNTENSSNTYLGDFVEGETAIIDMTGRVVATDGNTQLAPGVYIIRTVKGNETNSKKIIIK